MNNLVIANTQIRRDAKGRFHLNDLHRASGGEKRHQLSNWLRLDTTKELCAEIDHSSDVSSAHVINGGPDRGTFVVKELVYAYAMWISPKFHLHVIRAYDALVTGQAKAPPSDPSASMRQANALFSAARGFSTLVRVGRVMGMPRAHAVACANNATRRNTGIDLVAELDAADMLLPLPSELARPSGHPDAQLGRVGDWLAAREQVTTAEVIIQALGGDPQSRGMQTRVGMLLRRLGWQQSRQLVDGERVRRWHAPHVPAGEGDD